MYSFIYSESKLAELIGLPRKELHVFRLKVLRKNVHWQIHNGSIGLTARGIARLLMALGVPSERLDLRRCEFEEKITAPAVLMLTDRGQSMGPVRMRVRRLFPNPRLLETVEAARPNQSCHVLVRNNENFRVGMEFDAIPDPANPGYWILQGQGPRYPGRW